MASQAGLSRGANSQTPCERASARSVETLGRRDQEDEERDAQSATQRRVLRSHYRSLKAVIASEKDDLGGIDLQKFNALISSVDDLYSKVHRPRELIADGEAMYDITSSLLHSIKNFERKAGHSPAEFVTVIVQNFRAESGRLQGNDDEVDIDWEALGVEAFSILRDAPGVSTMIGPMDSQPKQRKVHVSRTRDKPGQSTRPEELAEVAEENQKTETDKNMEAMFKILRTCKRVQLEALVLNRISFSQTVENLFALSFLVKDGRAEITYGEDGSHVVVPRNAPSAGDRASGKVVNSQFVFRFDFKDWRFMQECLEDGKELMPHRHGSVPRPSLTPVRKNSRNRARETSTALAVEENEELRPKKLRL